MKILQVMTELGYGGAERVVFQLSRVLAARGHSVCLAVLKSPSGRTMEAEFRAAGIEPHVIGINSPAEIYRVVRLAKLIRDFRPDVIHSHLMHPNLLCRAANLFTGIPLVCTVHISERRPGRKLFFIADALTSFLCSRYTAVSEASARFHERAAHLAPGSVSVVCNGVDPKPLPAPEVLTAAREHWRINMCSKVLGCVGRLDRQKGFDNLLRTLKSLRGLVPPGETWGVVILGEGPERENLETLASALGLGNIIVRLPGFAPDASSLCAAFDAFVMPSRYEGYGLVMAEAMNFGLPVVYSPVDSLPELARNYPAAFPAKFDDPSADAETASVLARSLNTPRSTPSTLCSVERMAENYLDLYGTLRG